MRTIGLLGGMSWESSAEYYRLVNEAVRERLGGFHSAKCLMLSVDFAEIEAMQASGDWEAAGERLAECARSLEAGGAELLILCTNTMHRLAGEIDAAVSIPFVHIADPTGAAIEAAGIGTIGLLGTRYTMEGEFYADRLRERHGLGVLVPEEPDRTMIHDVIYEELVLGDVRDDSRERYRRAIETLVDAGAGGIILGCTEIGLLVGEPDSSVPLFDTTRLHAEAAVELAIEAG